MDHTNKTRRDGAMHAIREHAKKMEYENPCLDLESAVTDLLTNLMHLCHYRGINWDMCAAWAERHFADEKKPFKNDLDLWVVADGPIGAPTKFDVVNCENSKTLGTFSTKEQAEAYRSDALRTHRRIITKTK